MDKKLSNAAYILNGKPLDENFVAANGYLFGSRLLPTTFYEARIMNIDGKKYVHTAIKESYLSLTVDRVRSTRYVDYYTLPIYNQNGNRWIPCCTGDDWSGNTAYIKSMNESEALLLKQLLVIDDNDYRDKESGVYKTGYAVSHWVFEISESGVLETLDKSIKSPKTQCAITGWQSAVWTIAHKSNGSTKKNGERVAYCASGFLPIDSSQITMFSYHSLGYFLSSAIGNFTDTNPTAKGFEIEGVFFDNIGFTDKTVVNPDLNDKVFYEGLYLNRRGIMATALLKLYRFQPLITSDCTVDFELLTKPCMSLNALKDVLCCLTALLDIKSSKHGNHIHISPTNDCKENLFKSFDAETEIFPVAEKVLTPFLAVLRANSISIGNNVSPVENIFGRNFARYARDGIGYCDHSNAFNITEYGTIEYRLSRYVNELQYLRLINMCCEITLEIYAVLSEKKSIADAQIQVLKIWDKTKRHNTKTDKNATKIPNKQGVRHRNEK